MPLYWYIKLAVEETDKDLSDIHDIHHAMSRLINKVGEQWVEDPEDQIPGTKEAYRIIASTFAIMGSSQTMGSVLPRSTGILSAADIAAYALNRTKREFPAGFPEESPLVPELIAFKETMERISPNALRDRTPDH